MNKRLWRASLACALGLTTIAVVAGPQPQKPDRRKKPELAPSSSGRTEEHRRGKARALRGASADTTRSHSYVRESHSTARSSGTGAPAELISIATGACCFGNASCIAEQTPADCLNAGGAYQGDTTTCEAGTCPLPDACTDRLPISGYGAFPFDNLEATDEPGSPTHEECALYNDLFIIHDLWFCWTADATEVVALETCGTGVDTKIAIYDGCTCLPRAGDLLTCNDDGCDWSRDYESSATFETQAGQSYLIRVGTTSLYGVMGGPGSFTISPVDLPCDDGSAQFCQSPNQYDARASDRTTGIVADDFTPALTGDVAEVCWWGVYADLFGDCKGRELDDFVIRYYQDDNGKPGTLLAEFSQSAVDPADQLTVTGPVATPNLVLTGIGPGYLHHFPEYEYTGTHASVGVTAGACYWIEISNSVGNYCQWFWEIGGSYTGRAFWDRDGVDPPVYASTDVVALDQAFCLDIDVGDAAQQCPLASPCAGRDTDCCVNNMHIESVGCGDLDCCEEVCACDPFCCAVGWDEACATADWCSAATLCPSLCETCPEGEVNWAGSSPHSGVVDARQPRDVADASSRLGIRYITVAAPPDADDSDCWEVCETKVEGLDNFVRAADDNNDGTFLISLHRRITPGAVTKLTYAGAPTGTDTGTFTFLPGDSNADGVSNSQDILTQVECCLSGTCVPPHGDYSCDINHSNLATSEDILRTIDLFIGAGEFLRGWYDATPDLNIPCP